MSNFDLIWERVTKVLSFLLGVGIGVYETVLDRTDRPYLLAFAAALIGPPLARSFESGLSKLRSNAPTQLPKEPVATRKKR